MKSLKTFVSSPWKFRLAGVFFFLAAIAFLAGCVSMHPKSGFLTLNTHLKQGTHFKQENILPGRSFDRFRKVKVTLVDVSYLMDNGGYDRNEVRMLRDYFQEALENKLREQFIVVRNDAETDYETLVIRAALVYVMPPAKNVRIGEEWASTGIPVSTGGAAFEAKLLDGENGHLLAEIAERQSDGKSVSAVTVQPYNRYTNVETVFRKWAEQLLAFLEDHRARTGEYQLKGTSAQMPELLVQDYKAIEALQKRWVEEELQGNGAGLAALCTEDIRWIPPDSPPLEGKYALRNWFRDSQVPSVSIHHSETDISGNGALAYLTSQYSKVQVPKGGFWAETVKGTQFWVLRKTPLAGWQVAVSGWTQDGPPTSMSASGTAL